MGLPSPTAEGLSGSMPHGMSQAMMERIALADRNSLADNNQHAFHKYVATKLSRLQEQLDEDGHVPLMIATPEQMQRLAKLSDPTTFGTSPSPSPVPQALLKSILKSRPTSPSIHTAYNIVRPDRKKDPEASDWQLERYRYRMRKGKRVRLPMSEQKRSIEIFRDWRRILRPRTGGRVVRHDRKA